MVEEHLAQANYQIKVQAKQFRDTLLEHAEAGVAPTGLNRTAGEACASADLLRVIVIRYPCGVFNNRMSCLTGCV